MKHDIKKKQKSLFQKLFRSTSPAFREEDNSINFSVLRKMIKTKEHEDILNLIENETIPSVREAWIDYFLEKTKS
jgi:hypothetical protein